TGKLSDLRTGLEAFSSGEEVQWRLLAERGRLFHDGLQHAVNRSLTEHVGTEVDALWDLAASREKEIAGQIDRYYHYTFEFHTNRQRLLRNAKGLIATARVAIAAQEAAVNPGGRALAPLQDWAERAAALLGREPITPVGLGDIEDAVRPEELVLRIFNQIK